MQFDVRGELAALDLNPHAGDGVPNRVLVFTDGLNQDASSLSLAQLKTNLAKAHDPKRPVNLSLVIFGDTDAPVEAWTTRSAPSTATSPP
jgi:hypothetical protein